MYQLGRVRILKVNSAQNGNTVVFNLRLDRAVCEVFREALSTNLRAVLLHVGIAGEEATHMLWHGKIYLVLRESRQTFKNMMADFMRKRSAWTCIKTGLVVYKQNSAVCAGDWADLAARQPPFPQEVAVNFRSLAKETL
jgi:hypothetical protein